ncbi:MAG: flavodoxin family protein [Eubacterium sp.]|nr:flavodoxin family protein [Eubacterium sp.]
MRVLILNGSPRPKGHTKQMIQAFCEGLEEAGHEWDVFDVCKMNIHGCLACEYCHTKGNGQCIQEDDMQNIYQKLSEAGMLVIASPIYYHNMSGQLKCAIDRFYAAAYPVKPPKLKKVAMFLSSGEPDMYDGALFSYQGDFLDFLKLEGMGVFTTKGYDPGLSEEKREELQAFGASLKH